MEPIVKSVYPMKRIKPTPDQIIAFGLVVNKYGYMNKPSKDLYPYDAATGWQNLNNARLIYGNR
ncbi:hypothetical protein GCM10028806_33660 [Spirosoma terrae]